MRKKEKILSAIKLKYYQKEKGGSGPRHDGIECFVCGKMNIAIGAVYNDESGEPKFICEDCAIDAYQEKHRFKNREAAAARRRRIFDVGYLFSEMVTDKYLEEMNYKSIDDLSDQEISLLLNISREKYNSLFTKEEKTKLEETESQADIEKKLREKLKYVEF